MNMWEQLSLRRSGVSALAVAVALSAAHTQTLSAQDAADADDESLEEIVVTGFRSSLGAALDLKQGATGQVDAIVADDIADFPDLNLAEALQRIPGVAITRQNGEGNQITVRGLSGQYTRVRINGMETRAGNSTNTGRAFDFNMFAAELFNSIVIRKTASADLDEGSLGATVDLNTGRAMNYEEGFTAVVDAQGSYNDLTEQVKPRFTGLIAYNDPDGKFGATASIAYSKTRTDVATGNTVRWQKSNFRSVRGVVCADNPDDAGCAEVSDAFHARIPRYGTSKVNAERIGITAGLEFKPTEKTHITLDGLYSSFDTDTEFKTIEVLFRGNAGGMDVTDYTIQSNPDRFGSGNDTLISMDVDDAWVRSETFFQETESKFHQVNFGIEHEFSSNFYVDLLAGTSRSEGHLPRNTTLMYDDRDYNGYSYDYSGSDQYPVLAFNGPDVNDGTNFQLTEVRDQVHTTETGFDTIQFNMNWEYSDALKFTAGVNYKKATLDTEQSRRDGTVCGLGLFDCDPDGDGVNELLGAPGTDALSAPYTYAGEVGAGSDSTWASPDLDGWTDFLGLYDVPLSVDQGRVRSVEEINKGAFLQASGQVMLGDMRLTYNGGVRYVETSQTSGGFNSGVFVEVERDKYKDWLPSANLALWVANDVVVRFAAADVMSRPALSNLSPGGSVDSFNYTINFQNPNLNPTRATALDASIEWYFADEAVLSLALFSKDIESFPIRELRRGTFASTGLPTSVISPTSPASQDLEGTCGNAAGCWEISELTDGPGAKIKGFEVGFQSPFSQIFGDLPPIIENMGIIANYTYVDSDTEFNYSGTIVTEKLINLSNNSYNATLYYEDEKFGARISVANRSEYNQSGPNRSGNLWQFVEANTRVDFSASYQVTEHLEVTFEALNLTDTPFDAKVDIDANRRLQYDKTGRNFLLGARYKF
jgi:TonB-dependent receptor